MPGARRLSIVEKLQLIQILVADLDISPLEPFKTHDVLFFMGVLILTMTIESIGLCCIYIMLDRSDLRSLPIKIKLDQINYI